MTIRVTCMGFGVPGPLHIDFEPAPATRLSLRELITCYLTPRFEANVQGLLFDAQGLRDEYVILVNGRNVLGLGGLDAPIEDDAELLIMPPVGGG